MLSSNIHDSSQPLQCNDSCKLGCRDIDPPHSNKHRYVSMVSAAFCYFSLLYQKTISKQRPGIRFWCCRWIFFVKKIPI